MQQRHAAADCRPYCRPPTVVDIFPARQMSRRVIQRSCTRPPPRVPRCAWHELCMTTPPMAAIRRYVSEMRRLAHREARSRWLEERAAAYYGRMQRMFADIAPVPKKGNENRRLLGRRDRWRRHLPTFPARHARACPCQASPEPPLVYPFRSFYAQSPIDRQMLCRHVWRCRLFSVPGHHAGCL